MTQIKNIGVYNQRMEKSVYDKMFFMDKIFSHIDTIVDFGCANGALIKNMKALFPEYKYIGYDFSRKMISLAHKLVPDCNCYCDWDSLSVQGEKSLLNISSTIHEVYSYGSPLDIEVFWNRVFGSGFKYIAVRDMMVSNKTERAVNLAQLDVIKNCIPGTYKNFVSVLGDIETQKDLIHLLLKYDYLENWNREVRENYLPITVEDFLSLIPNTYEIVYQEHYVLPYIKQKIFNDFGVNLTDPTHFKILLKRRENT